MTTMGIIITKMAICLVIALFIGFFFGYLLAKARSKEYYEDKMDTLEELCEAKKIEAQNLKTKYGNMEIESVKLQDQCSKYEETIATCKKREEEMLEQLEVIAKKNETLQQKLQSATSDIEEEKGRVKDILDKINEIDRLLHAKKDSIKPKIEKEITEELKALKIEIQTDTRSNKVIDFLQNIIKKIKR